MSVKVSIATCTYNRPEMLRRAVESLRAQTDPEWEHLICDDGSTDPGVAAVLAWACEDSRVRAWRREDNLDRPAAVWNFLLDQSRGEYLTTLDDDNEKLPLFVERMAGELDRERGVDLVTCGFVVRTAGDEDWEHHHNLETTREVVAARSTCEGGTLLYRRGAFSRVGYFSESIRTNEDWEWLRRAVAVLNIKNLSECYTVYHQHSNNRQKRAEDLGHSLDVAGILKGGLSVGRLLSVDARPIHVTVTK